MPCRGKKTKSFAIILILAVFPPAVHSAGGYPLAADENFSCEAGAYNLLSLHSFFRAGRSAFLKNSLTPEATFAGKTAGVSYRAGKTVFVDNVFDHYARITQHQFFGHGARYREFGYTKSVYTLDAPFPYDNGDGSAEPGSPDPGRVYTAHESLACAAAGFEANTVLSRMMIKGWLGAGHIETGETFLFFLSCNDLYGCVLRTKTRKEEPGGNDVNNYLYLLNTGEGRDGGYRLTVNDLKSASAVNLLQPFQYLSLYAFLYKYLWTGEEYCGIPMIGVCGAGYLPSLRLGLTPFGPEYRLDNYFARTGKTADVYFRYGDPAFHDFSGCGIAVEELAGGEYLSLGAGLDFWDQPPLVLGGDRAEEKGGRSGSAFSGTFIIKPAGPRGAVYLMLQLGYKTAGYLEGEQLDEGIIARLGLNLIN